MRAKQKIHLSTDQRTRGLPIVQRGAALLVSLLILLVLSLVGLAAMRGGLLQNLMSANTTQDTMAFQAADSAIGAFMLAANTGSPAIPAFITSTVMATPRSYTPTARAALSNLANAAAWTRCVDQNGNLALSCGAFDGETNRAGQINARVSVGYFPPQPGMPTEVCPPGTQLDQRARVRCHIFQIVGTATVGDAPRPASTVTLGVRMGASGT